METGDFKGDGAREKGRKMEQELRGPIAVTTTPGVSLDGEAGDWF